MLSTLTFDVKATVNTLFQSIVNTIQSEVNAVLGTSHTIQTLTRLPVIDYPAFVLTWVEVDSPAENKRKYGFVNVGQFTKSSPENPDDRLPDILSSSFMDKLGFTSKTTSDMKWLALNNPDALPNIDQTFRKASIELSHGFRLVSTQENITHKVAGFVVKYH